MRYVIFALILLVSCAKEDCVQLGMTADQVRESCGIGREAITNGKPDYFSYWSWFYPNLFVAFDSNGKVHYFSWTSWSKSVSTSAYGRHETEYK